MGKPLIIANWKCNPTTSKEAEHLFVAVKKEVRNIKNVEVVICPPFVWLGQIFEELSSSKKGLAPQSVAGNLRLGAQDCFWEERGAYTGEISPLMLKNLGCQYVIIGHSERRKYFQEADEIINKKVKAALKTRLRPVLCIGEEVEDEIGLVVGEQIENGLAGIAAARVREVAIAYEPVWAIGTGLPCSPDGAMKAALFVRKTLTKLYDRSIAEKVKILYGGSVTSQNAIDYIKGAMMDGLLIGQASLNATEFVKIVNKINEL